MTSWHPVLAAAQSGTDTALARFVSALERDDWAAMAELGQAVASRDPGARSVRIGITGAAGAGKSTLVAALAAAWPGEGRVGAVAVDPSSEATGGALLGDRFRLYDHDRDRSDHGSRMFLRSVAARGSHGALSRHLGAIVTLFEVIDLDPVVVETAGAGQSDVGVRDLVDCLVLVLNPDSGDVIQMLKAGLMEWADLYVVNKADRPGAGEFAASLRGVVARQGTRNGVPPARRVLSVQANDPGGASMDALVEAIRSWPRSGRERRDMWSSTVEELLLADLVDRVRSRARSLGDWAALVESAAAGKRTPDEVITEVLPRVGGDPNAEGASR